MFLLGGILAIDELQFNIGEIETFKSISTKKFWV